jgi:hypothetical protein
MCWAGGCHNCAKTTGSYCCSPGTPNQCTSAMGCDTSTGRCN